MDAICRGQPAPAARLITRIEQGDCSVTPLLQSLYRRGGQSRLIGITGPPGVGKSTLTNRLIAAYRQQGKRVAVLAVDPSSPFTGGAILGDRVRMNQHAGDPGVFIRSMGSRGQLGGLAKATADALTVLDAMNFDVIVVETVGVGQSEIDILRHVHCVLLLQTPDSGDRIQAAKAGLLEIGDIYIVNKADHEGAEVMMRGIADMLQLQSPADEHQWLPPVLATQASAGTGVDELLAHIERHRLHLRTHRLQNREQETLRLRHRVVAICQQLTRERLLSPAANTQMLEQALEKIRRREADPYGLAATIIGQKSLDTE